jgi:hypothetical protein
VLQKFAIANALGFLGINLGIDPFGIDKFDNMPTPFFPFLKSGPTKI